MKALAFIMRMRLPADGTAVLAEDEEVHNDFKKASGVFTGSWACW